MNCFDLNADFLRFTKYYQIFEGSVKFDYKSWKEDLNAGNFILTLIEIGY